MLQDEIHQTLVKAFPNDNVFAVTFEHSLKEQVEMLHRLDVLISVEGSAIENVIFARRGLGVVILGYFYGDREVCTSNVSPKSNSVNFATFHFVPFIDLILITPFSICVSVI